MKIRIREGNDFDVAWAIKRGGVPEDLSTAINMKLTLVVYGLVIEHSLFTVTDNLLSINIPKEVATVNGDYRLIFEYTLPDAGQPDGDLKCKTDVVPFRIVPFTAKADDIYTINVTSDIAIGLKGDKGDDGADAYQIWLDLGNEGTYEDFIAYLRQPAVDAGASISELEGEIQVNEGLRVQAESERVQAESERQITIQEAVTATQEATTAASLADTARLAIQDDLALKANQTDLAQLAGDVSVKLNNIITNGNFVDETKGWILGSNITETSVADSILSFTGGGALNSSANNWVRRANETMFPKGHFLYNIVTARSLTGAMFYVGVGYSFSGNNITDQWGTYSYLGNRPDGNHPTYGAGLGHTVEMTNAMCFDLTEIFGEGNEPTKEEMDLLISTLGIDYFEGEITIPAQKVMQWQLKMIRQNRSAIIALGGTIV